MSSDILPNNCEIELIFKIAEMEISGGIAKAVQVRYLRILDARHQGNIREVHYPKNKHTIYFASAVADSKSVYFTDVRLSNWETDMMRGYPWLYVEGKIHRFPHGYISDSTEVKATICGFVMKDGRQIDATRYNGYYIDDIILRPVETPGTTAQKMKTKAAPVVGG